MKLDVENFMKAGKQLPVENETRQSMLYIGLQLEELSEKIAASGIPDVPATLDTLASLFKAGSYDHLYAPNRVEQLDADLDLLWVTLGAMLTRGNDIEGGWNEVKRSNMSKVWEDGTMHKTDYGKIIKPKSFSEPNLYPFV